MSLWTAQQTEWLEAMGLQVLQVASNAPADAPPVPRAGGEPPGETAARATPSPRLHQALLHALRSCTDPAAVLASMQIDIQALRNDAAGKRALWPRLRASRVAQK